MDFIAYIIIVIFFVSIALYLGALGVDLHRREGVKWACQCLEKKRRTDRYLIDRYQDLSLAERKLGLSYLKVRNKKRYSYIQDLLMGDKYGLL